MFTTQVIVTPTSNNLKCNNNQQMDNWKPDALVIGPGGIKGLKALGFLVPLEDIGTLTEIKIFCGVSVGAIVCLLLICGYSVREIIKEAVLLDIFKELDSFDLSCILENKGLISNEMIKRALTNLVFEKFGVVPSLKGLQTLTGKSLITSVLNVTDEECLMMNPVDNPDVSCVDAVLYSSNIPFVFYQLTHEEKICADGILSNPYPVDYLDNNERKILGIYMKGTTDSYYTKLFGSVIEQRRRAIIQFVSEKCVHVCLEINKIATFSLTIQEKADLLVEGLNQGMDFLNGTYKLEIPEKQKYKCTN